MIGRGAVNDERSTRQRPRMLAVALAAVTLSAGQTACATDAISGAIRSSAPPAGATSPQAIVVAGVRRTFLLHVPAAGVGPLLDEDTPPRTAYPLLLVLHGSSGSGAAIQGASQMDSL